MNKILAFSLLFFSSIWSQTYQINHNINDLVISEFNGLQKIQYSGQNSFPELTASTGQPELPVYIWSVPLDENIEIIDYEVKIIQKTLIPGKHTPTPVRSLWSQKSSKQEPPQVKYNKAQFPAKNVKLLAHRIFNGKKIAQFAVYPVSFKSDDMSLMFNNQIELSVITDLSENEYPVPLLSRDANVLKNAVTENGSFSDKEENKSIITTEDLHNQGLSVRNIDRYVIITDESLRAFFEPLIEWKSQKGVPAAITTIQEINSQFPNGIDDSERIRDYLRWSYMNRGTKYVLLGGDTHIIPTRTITTGGYTFPTDYYFSDLNGSWNANQNDIFGEADDQLDGYPELYVSRFPAQDESDVQRFVNRVLKYEKLDQITETNYPNNILYLAANLSRDNDGKDLIMKHVDPQVGPSFQRTLLTQSEHIGDNPSPALQELNKGYGIVFSENHGAYNTIRPGAKGSNIYTHEMNSLQNADHAIWYMASCETNDILKRAIGEEYMLAENGGGVAYIGNSSWEYPFSGIYLQKEFFNLAFNKGYYHLAEAHFLSRLPYLGYLSWEGPSRIIVFSTVVLGDPEMPIWTDAPTELDIVVSHPDQNGTNFLQVEIKDLQTELPIENATVTIYQKDEIYLISNSNENGLAQFDLSNIGELAASLTITKHNFIPLETTIDLQPPSGIRIARQNFSFDEIHGNSNEKIEPGEMINLDLEIKNVGTLQTELPFWIRFVNSDSSIILSEDSISIGSTILPDEVLQLPDIELLVDTLVKRDTTFNFLAYFESAGKQVGSQSINIDVVVPNIELTNYQLATNQVSDTTYQSTLSIEIANAGNGDVSGLSMHLSTTNQSTQIQNDSLFIEKVASGNTFFDENGIVFEHLDLIDSISISLLMKDHYKNTWLAEINFNSPPAPDLLKCTPAGPNAVQLSWSPSFVSDIDGYNIYRKESESISFKQINETIVSNAGFYVDNSVDQNTSYEYKIQAIDKSGNVSNGFSETVTTWPAVPYQNSFPRFISSKAIGSELSAAQVFDLNQDGSNEIIVVGGHGVLHIYNSDGELIVENENLQGYLTAPAIGNVHGDSGYELVLTGYAEGKNTNVLYVIDPSSGNIIREIPLLYNVPGAAVLEDCDGDGLDDIILLTHAGNAPSGAARNSRLFIWKSTGSDWITFPGWLEEGFTFDDNYAMGMPAVGILEQAGSIDIVVATAKSKVFRFSPLSPVPIWEKTISEAVFSAPISLADINKDNNLEIILPSLKSNKLYVLNAHGIALSGWQSGIDVEITDPWGKGSPAIAGNFDDDAELEIFYAGRKHAYLFEHNAISKEGFPLPIKNGDSFYTSGGKIKSPYSSPVTADLNQDGYSELIFVTTHGVIHALDAREAGDIPGFPVQIESRVVQGQSPLVHDLDSDGDLDVLFIGHDGVLHIWDYPVTYGQDATLSWNQMYGNEKHTGELSTTELTGTSSLNYTTSQIPKNYYLKPNYPNPFNPKTKIEFGLSGQAFVELQIFDILGRNVATLVSGIKPAGIHIVTWKGINGNGQSVASGLYFQKLTVKNLDSSKRLFSQIGKMILIK